MGEYVVILFGVFTFLYGCFGTPMDNTEFQKSLPEKIVWGVLGQTVQLPCDLTPPTPSDYVKMLFWFKDDIGIPWYSLDARSGLSRASHLTISGDLGDRLYFIMDEQPSLARLKIENVTIHDQGLYRCRVDFVNSPTRNFQVNLTLIEQPSIPRVFDAEGREIVSNSSAGPFLEGEELFLSCQVNGGKPRPDVTWWYGNSLLDSVVDTSSTSFTTVNQLFIPIVTRQLKNARFECRATSSEKAGHKVTIIPLVVYLKPDKVKIVTPNELMSYRKSQNVRCETSGSFPPAKLTWLLDGKPIKQAIVTEEETEFFTASILSLSVSSEDDGKELICRADNPGFPGGKLQETRRIHVSYPPKVKVLFEDSSVKEGDEVKLRCVAKARPNPYVFRWYHEGHLVHFNSTSGVFPMDDVIVMKHVDRKSSGQYACSATNSEGETYSTPIHLQVQFTPRCKKGQEETRVGVLPGQKLQVQCHVDASPDVDKFFWTFNTSLGVLSVDPTKGMKKNEDGVSSLSFEPPDGYSWDDIKALSCWAANGIGQQIQPCTFFIIPADVPEKPRDCVYRNTSTLSDESKVRIVCRPGGDGGLPQTFVLEVKDVTSPNLDLLQQHEPPPVTTLSDQGDEYYDRISQSSYHRITGERPVFEVANLKDGREYELSIYAVNAKGRGPSYRIRNIRMTTLNVTNSTIFSRKPDDLRQGLPAANLAPIYVVLTSCAVILMIVIITSVVVLACRKTAPSEDDGNVHSAVKMRTKRQKNEEYEINSDAGFGEGFHRRSAQYRASMYGPSEIETRISTMIERPDLILSPRGLLNDDDES